MMRALLDTNIYGRLVEEQEHNLAIAGKDLVKVYGSVIIRRELRNIPKRVKVLHEGTQKKIRLVVLDIYDFLVGGRTLSLTLQVEELAEQYFVAHKKFAGTKADDEIFKDFSIVATATLNRLEVVYSDDRATMLSHSSIKAYDFVNALHGLSTPLFKSYEAFIDGLKKLIAERRGRGQ